LVEVNNPPIAQTKAQLAAAMLAAINADVTINALVVATQDTPGVDEYYYIESIVPGTDYNTSLPVNSTEASLRKNNAAPTPQIGGGIIISPNA
jgi:hypothetical protein